MITLVTGVDNIADLPMNIVIAIFFAGAICIDDVFEQGRVGQILELGLITQLVLFERDLIVGVVLPAFRLFIYWFRERCY